MDTLSSPIPRSTGNIAYLSRAWPSKIRGLGNMRPGAWAYGATEGGLHMLQCCATPKATLPGPPHAHYVGDIMRVVGYGRGCAGAMSWRAMHSRWGVEMGRSAPTSTFSSILAVSLSFSYIFNIIMKISEISIMKMSEQTGDLGTSECSEKGTARTPRRTLRFSEPTAAGFLLEYRAPTNLMHLQTKSDVIPSFITGLRADPTCRRTEIGFSVRGEMRPVALSGGLEGA